MTLACVLPLLLAGCVERHLVAPGHVLSVQREAGPLAPTDPGYETTLQVKWLGTACYLIRLGDEAIFTDPFVTHHSLLQAGLGRIASDPAKVKAALDGLPAPRAVFTSHSHYDHLLDAAECLKQPGWADVPIFGSPTTRNILAGYGGPERNCRLIEADGKWHALSARIRYKALPSEHARQLPGLPPLYPGTVDTPRTTPPTRAADFPMGGCYNFVFEFSHPKLAAPFVVHFAAGAAGGDPRGWVDATQPPVDVAMLCVASWKFVGDGTYPAGFLGLVKPRNVVLAHFDNFFQVDGKTREVVPFAYLDEFLFKAQQCADYPGFEKIIVPDVGTWMRFDKAPGLPGVRHR